MMGGSGISSTICNHLHLIHTDNHASTSHSVFTSRMAHALPATQPTNRVKALKAKVGIQCWDMKNATEFL